MRSDAARIVSLGEVVAEIIAEDRGAGFRQPLRLQGPYPSGAPAIFIDQAARLGHPAGLISCVGDDDFGWLNVERLCRDGVDTSAIRIHPDQATSTAFVRYGDTGERDFVFNIRHSAAGHTRIDAAGRALLDDCGHLHVMGSSLFSPALVAEAGQAIRHVKGRGGTVSFDPNIRKEMLAIPGMREALGAVLRQCDLFLPSGPELTLLTEAASEEGAIAEILGLGVSAIVVKRGRDGASWHSRDGALHLAAFPAVEIDPTGAGDCFGATFVTLLEQGAPLRRALEMANAAGAHVVTRLGPMEGNADAATLEAFLG